MIKARMSGPDGRQTVFLGLAFENLNRIREGEPVLVRGAEIGLDVDIVIGAGRDEEAIMADLRAAGLELPEPTVVENPVCPDDGEALLTVQSLDAKTKYRICPGCSRRFGMLPGE